MPETVKPELRLVPHTSPPAFRVGMPVKVHRHAGVLDAADPAPAHCLILEVRLASDGHEDWDGDDESGRPVVVVNYPRGWEYLVVRSAALNDRWGWVSEGQLIDKGYLP